MNSNPSANPGAQAGAAISPHTSRVTTIGVDARTFQYADSTSRGIGHYALHHLLATIPLRPDWQFILFNDSGKANATLERLLKFSNVSVHSLDAHPLPTVDLFHIPDPMNMSTGFDSPLRLLPGVKATVIFHDLIPLRYYWATWPEGNQQAYLLRLEQLRNRPVQILANSEFTRLDLIKGTGIPTERTDTIMAGLNRSENATVDPALFQQVRKQYGITKQFFLHVGALDPHKNFETVIQSFGRLTTRGSAQLVVVGQKEHYLKQIAAYVEQQKMKDIIFTGFLPRVELEALYQEAIATLFLSKYEGFGFPVLEAMAQGCPVITTNVTSIPEVAGDAALLFDPKDSIGIGQGMQKLLGSFTKREEMRRAGKAQAAKFTWDKTARKTVEVWEKMLGFAQQEVTAIEAKPVVAKVEEKGSSIVETPTAIEPVTETADLKRDVVWFAPWQNPSGYCSEALAFAQGIEDKISLELVDVAHAKSPAFVAGLPMHLKKILRDRLKEQVSPAGKISILHMPGSSLSTVPGAAYCIGRTMFETDRVPASWVTKCNQMDEVWVPSQFNADTFAASGVIRKKLVVMPEAVDEQVFNPTLHKPLTLPDRAKFNFLSVFEWSSRKGWDVLLSAYLREFSAQDDVCLYLRTYLTNQPEGNPTATIEKLIREHADSLNLGDKALPRIKILADQIAQADLPSLYKAVDCLVAPSRGEGWGRPHHEAMLMELPVIATNWSGNTEFMNADTAYLLDYELTEAKHLEADLWHYRGHRWANPSEKHLRELMRRVSQNRDEAVAKGKAARAHMVEHFSIAKVGEKVLRRLREVEAKISHPACPPTIALENKIPATTATAQSVQVALEGSYLDLGSLSHVNRELSRQLARQPQIKLTCVGKNTLPATATVMPVVQEMARRLQSQPAKNTQVTIRHAWPPSWDAPATGAWVLTQPWEFGVLPAEWVKQLARVDEAWVPSEYVRRVYLESGVEPAKVKVVPNGIDPEKFKPTATPMNLATRKTFKFLFVGGTIHRKGPDLLLAAYLKNFTAADDVCLVIKDFGGKGAYAGQTFEEKIKVAQSLPNAPEILYLNHDLSSDAIPGLYTACDCLVHPYRGEGFGLPVLEAMACGLPVVVTASGSTDDFASDKYAYRLPAKRQSIGAELSGLKLVREGWLLEPDADALTAKLKWIVSHREAAKAKGQAASEYVRREWTWERAAQIASAHIQNLIARQQDEAAALATRRSRKAAAITLPETAKVGQLNHARVLLSKKEFRSAWNDTLAAMAQRPFHCEAWLLLAEIALAAGDFDRAKSCAARAKALAPNWKAADKFAKTIPAKAGNSIAWPSVPDDAATPRLSVCLITKNEERFLEKCLASVRDLAHQIVVVDTGSTDSTVDIAKKFNADVHSIKWNHDFSAARNEALKYATGDWVLMLDADEELLPDHRATILKEIQTTSVMAYRLPIIDEGREQEGCSYVPRLFRNAPGLFFIGRVHEQIFSSIEVRCSEWGLENCLGKSTLLHHGYTKEIVTSRDKVARNLRLLELAIEELPNEPNLLMSFGLELVRSGQFAAGLEQYWEAFHVMSALPPAQVVPELRETLLTQLMTHLLTAKQFAEIIQLAKTPIAKSSALTASQHFTLGLAHMELQQAAEAAEQMRQCIARRKQSTLSPVNKDIFKAGPNHCLALSLFSLNQDEAAVVALNEALKDDPSSRLVRFDLARFNMKQGQPLEALKWLHELVGENPKEAQVWQFGGQVALSQAEFAAFARDWTTEALKHFPEHHGIMMQAAEALLLNQDAKAALSLWTKAHSPKSARDVAGLVLCEILTDKCQRRFNPAEEQLVSQEFLKWCRQLMKANAHTLVNELNEQIEKLRIIVPTFAKMWEAATVEVKSAPITATAA